MYLHLPVIKEKVLEERGSTRSLYEQLSMSINSAPTSTQLCTQTIHEGEVNGQKHETTFRIPIFSNNILEDLFKSILKKLNERSFKWKYIEQN